MNTSLKDAPEFQFPGIRHFGVQLKHKDGHMRLTIAQNGFGLVRKEG